MDQSQELRVTQPHLVWAPYVWKRDGAGGSLEAAMPGAYLKCAVRGTANLGIVIDATANAGCAPESMPVVDYAIDDGPFQAVQLSITGKRYVLPLAAGLNPAASHRLEFYFRAGDMTQARWTSPIARLRVGGLAVDAGGTLIARERRARTAIGFGDSITEGVGAESLFTSWQKMDASNARVTWFPIVCAALNCEYGQLGSGGQGMSQPVPGGLPPLPQTWDRFDAQESRLVEGRLAPEPDYVFCCMGTNDFDRSRGPDCRMNLTPIAADYERWLSDVRRACSSTRIFCVTPPFLVHADEIRAAVSARQMSGDERVHLIDLAPLQMDFRPEARKFAYDGCHPTLLGHAILGAFIAAETQTIRDDR